MTREEQLERVKQSLSVTGNYLDEPLGIRLDDIKAFMLDAGVKELVVNSEKAIGAICRGVSDLWNEKELSQYFWQRVGQLVHVDESEV